MPEVVAVTLAAAIPYAASSALLTSTNMLVLAPCVLPFQATPQCFPQVLIRICPVLGTLLLRDDARPFFRSTARELAREPLQSDRLQVFQEPFGRDDLLHEDSDVLVDRLMCIRLVRRKRKRAPYAFASKPGCVALQSVELFQCKSRSRPAGATL